MAVELASAYVSIIPTTKGIAGNLEKDLVGPMNAAAKKAGDEAGETMKKSLSETGKSFTKFGIGALAVAGGIGAGLLATGKSASDLGESVNAVKVTFGSAAEGILKLGEDAATSVGLSNAAFNGLAVQFSSFATTIAGKGGDVVGTMQELTGRAADFASVMNIDVAEAARVFQSGLAGETEPLKKFGIDLSDTAVKAFAASHGIGEFGKQLTEQEKVTARYGLLMEQTNKTQGDFANTSDSAANATRIAKAELENASASLGASFTPAIAFAAGTVASLASKFAALNEATDGWIGKALGIAALAAGVAGSLSLVVGQAIKMHDRFTTLKTAFVNAEGGLTRTGQAAKTAGIAMGVAGIALAAYSLRQQQNASNAEAQAKALDEVTRAAANQAQEISAVLLLAWQRFDDLSPEEAVKKLAQENLAAAIRTRDLAAADADYAKQLESQGITVNMLTSAINGEVAAKKRSEEATTKATEAVDGETEAVDDATAATQGLTIAQIAGKGAVEGIATATQEAKDKADAFAKSIENQQDKLEDLYGREYDAVQAKYDFADAQAAQMLAVDNFNTVLGDHKSKQEDVNAAQRAATDAIIDQAEKYATLDGAALDSEGAIQRQISSLKAQRDSLAPDSPLRVFLDQYIKDLAEIPSNVSTILDLHISSGQVTTKDGDFIGVRGVHARGGYTRKGPALVGEEGPEIVDMPEGAYVHTAAESRAMMSASQSLTGAGVPPITVNNYRRDIGVADLNQILAMARLVA